MTERLTDEQLLAWRDKLGGPSVGVVTELLALRARVAKLEAALQKLYDEGEYASVEFMQEVAALLKGAP